MREPAAALESFDKAIGASPDCADAYLGRGNAQKDLEQFDAALASYEKAIESNANLALAYCNRGNVLAELRRTHEAVASYQRAIAINPESADAHFGRAFVLLLSGELEAGWEDYEWRWNRENTPTYREKRNFDKPRWTGEGSIAGKTILLHREQGFGDAIQFCRYAKLLADRGAKVILEIHGPLKGLMANLQGVYVLIERGDPIPDFDWWCPLLSLPLAFKTKLDTVPSSSHYLHSNLGKLAIWKRRLGHQSLPRVGLAWSGGRAHQNDRNRSLALAALLPYLPQGIQYVSLQKETRVEDQDLLRCGAPLLDVSADLHDFSETAALCDCMDVVISVDSSVAHLAAALGKPTWILLPVSPDWRWLLDRDDSPWYPTATLLRQTSPGDWDGVLERVRSGLIERFAVS